MAWNEVQWWALTNTAMNFGVPRKKGKEFDYRGADKFLARPTSRCVLFDGEDISFDASLVIYINSTNIPLIVITNCNDFRYDPRINRIYENQNILSL